MTIEQIAKVAHEVNREYCKALGEGNPEAFIPKPFDELAPEYKQLVIDGVKGVFRDPNQLPSESHEKWVEYMRKLGWQYGPAREPAKMKHPNLVPYLELDTDQRAKDYLFLGVVRSLMGYLK